MSSGDKRVFNRVVALAAVFLLRKISGLANKAFGILTLSIRNTV